MAYTPNNTKNVSTGKGIAGGYFFLAPVGTPVPTDNASPLDEAFVNVGFLGEDGVSFSDSSDSTSYYDMNGDTVDTGDGSVEKKFTVTPIEVKRDALALCVGRDNVTDADGLITSHDKGPSGDTWEVVFELLLKNGRKWRRIGRQVKIGELGDLAFNYSNLVGREVTMSVLKDAETGDYWTDYIDSTETVSEALALSFSKPGDGEIPAPLSGKTFADLGSTEVSADGSKVRVSGALNKVDGWDEFSSNPADLTGYYVALLVGGNPGSYIGKTTQAGAWKVSRVADCSDGWIVAVKKGQKSFSFKSFKSRDDAESRTGGMAYTVDLSAVEYAE